MKADPIITIADVRPFFCVKGIKKAFADADADIDFAQFLQHGLKASELRGKGLDAAVDRVVAAINAKED